MLSGHFLDYAMRHICTVKTFVRLVLGFKVRLWGGVRSWDYFLGLRYFGLVLGFKGIFMG